MRGEWVEVGVGEGRRKGNEGRREQSVEGGIKGTLGIGEGRGEAMFG